MRMTIGDYITRGLAAAHVESNTIYIERQGNLSATERAMRELALIQKQAEAKERKQEQERIEADRAQAALLNWKPNFGQSVDEVLSPIEEAVRKNQELERVRLSKVAQQAPMQKITTSRTTSQRTMITRAAGPIASGPLTPTERKSYLHLCDVCGRGAPYSHRGGHYCQKHVQW